MPSLGNDGGNSNEAGGKASERCCSHAEGEDWACERSLCLASPSSRRQYHLLFMTRGPWGPFRRRCRFVGGCLQELFPNKGIKVSYGGEFLPGKWGFHGYDVMLRIPEGVEFVSEDWRRFQMLCTPEGQPAPIVFPQLCCGRNIMVVEGCIQDFMSEDGVLCRTKFQGRSAEEDLQQLAECISSVVATACHSR